MGPSQLIVGIDLGTTHTVLAWTRHPGSGSRPSPTVYAIPQLVTAHDIHAEPLLPSFLYSPTGGEAVADPWHEQPWVVGRFAERRGREVPGRLIQSAKSWLCHPGVDRSAAILPWGMEDPSLDKLSPIEASCRLLEHLRRVWDAAHPETPLAAQQIVLTVPASFDAVARELTLRAAHQAGLAVRLLEEPQAAFYDYLASQGPDSLVALLAHGRSASVLVCDVGGGTTDLTLIRVEPGPGGLALNRTAVGRHLLLGGDNMDLTLAQLCEPRLVDEGSRLDPKRFGQLVHACHVAKERLLSTDAPEELPITVLGSGASLLGSSRSTVLRREEVERVVLEGFFPRADRTDVPTRQRSGFVAFGLPYERDPGITRHLAAFFTRHAEGQLGPSALLLNGGVFRAQRLRERLIETLAGWGGPELVVLEQDAPDLSVARGAVAYGLALNGFGLTIGGGTARGYYVGLEGGHGTGRRGVCVVPRGAREGERHLADRSVLALRVGRPVRFELYAADQLVHGPGEVTTLDPENFEPLPPISTTFAKAEGDGAEEVRVVLEGELTAIGTIDLACVELDRAGARRHRLAFDLRQGGPEGSPGSVAPMAPGESSRAPGLGRQKLEEAMEAIELVFGKGRKDITAREVKDLWRSLERVLGERPSWTTPVTRALFDALAPKQRARRRSADHERLFWMLAGYCLRPGFGHPLDPTRVELLAPLFAEGLAFSQEARGWQQFFIAWRRVAGGLTEAAQTEIRDRLDPFLAPAEAKLKRPKGFKPQAPDELLETASWLERVAVERRQELGRWILERTWTDRDPRLWVAIGRLGARVPAYASVHYVIPPHTVERWLDHAMREKWDEIAVLPRVVCQLARVTDDRARDVADAVRREVAERLERVGTPAEWVRSVRELVPVAERERVALFGEDLPVGLRLLGS